MFRQKNKRRLERQVPFTEKHAVEINALWTLMLILAIAFISFDIGFILGGV